ncbi:MAG: 2-C-methyl-D-erythritol 2,4-cyclodiphosphate synthase [Dehalococcoidia bacterium]|nr:2-C-methyl-D-erythritol 2,4-cyclodiphosphate synthase [Dehalococcoidia bacterium]
MTAARVGLGFDSHALVEGRALIIGGVRIEHTHGLHGHSDGDALAHAMTDALLGAAGLGDIGQHFPSSDPAYKDADSMELLRRSMDLVEAAQLRLGNADATLYADAPRLGPYRDAMIQSLAMKLRVEPDKLNLKFKTLEGLPLGGAGGAAVIAAHVIVALEAEA